MNIRKFKWILAFAGAVVVVLLLRGFAFTSCLIPSTGMENNLPIYERCIVAYEGNKLEVKPDGIYINGEKTNEYTFKMDYYWMMGDNRHNSADSRYWGFVPEDHVVGKPIVVWLSLDKDRGWFDGKIRWNRLFKWVD